MRTVAKVLLACTATQAAWLPQQMPLPATAAQQPITRPMPRVRPLHACICINCKLVDQCATYHWVEMMHEQPHVTDMPTFEPNDPQIQVFIRNEGDAENAVRDAPDAGAEGDGGVRTSVLTTEYDVFECDSFVEDAGKWIRLMPDADYIPT
jgi:hypothetical protein